MKVILFHPVLLPPVDYGGVERVVLWLAEGLRDLGHSVSIAALEDSILPEGVKLIPINAANRSASVLLQLTQQNADIVHFHAPPEEEFRAKAPIPYLTTIHGNAKPGEKYAENSVFLSADHARRHGHSAYVFNGVNPAEFRLGQRSDKSPLFLSKTTLKVKNLKGAIGIATRAGQSLSIAGGNRPIGLRIKALLQGHRWIGPVAGTRKAEVLCSASALLFPVRWPEPFGLVMVESLMSGVPVVGSRIGSVPEILQDWGGVTVPMDAEPQHWVNALEKVSSLDSQILRNKAIERFSHLKMAEAYVEAYKKVLRGEVLK